MRRTQERLSRAASAVEADLRRTTGLLWSCTVDDEFILNVSDGTRAESVLLETVIEDPEWFFPPNATPAQRDEALVADAAETIADEVLEVMRLLDADPPSCPTHHRRLGSCSGLWTCEGPRVHDFVVGELGI